MNKKEQMEFVARLLMQEKKLLLGDIQRFEHMPTFSSEIAKESISQMIDDIYERRRKVDYVYTTIYNLIGNKFNSKQDGDKSI